MIHFRNFRDNEYLYNVEEVQIVFNAICNLLGREYVPIKKGIQAFDISSRVSKVLAEYGVESYPTGDIGCTSALLQDLIELLEERNILMPEEIDVESQKVSEQYPPLTYIKNLKYDSARGSVDC